MLSIHIIIILSIMAGVLLIYKLLQWAIKNSDKPDPWDLDKEAYEAEDGKDGEETPLCINCLSPVENSFQDYCPNCGNVTGKFTRYVPFINIPFNYSIISTLWKTLKGRKQPFMKRTIAFFACLILAPPILIIGIPVLIISFFIKKKEQSFDSVDKDHSSKEL